MTFRPRLCTVVVFAGVTGLFLTPPLFAQALKIPGSASIEADRIEGINEEVVEARGNVLLRQDKVELRADHLVYRALDDEIEADGNIRLRSDRYDISGPRLRLKLVGQSGFVERPEYALMGDPKKKSFLTSAKAAHGSAERIDFEGENHYSLTGATYSTCEPGDDAWYAKFSELDFDYDREVGEGWGAKVVFKGVPIFYTPYITFPLSHERRSGLLAPTWGNTTLSGLELTVPFYWNIAPNFDATLAPRTFRKRGNQLGSEFRYLGHSLRGDFFSEVLPDDKLRRDSRWTTRWRHEQRLGQGLVGTVDISRVSDDFYFKDLASQITVSAQTQLAQQVGLNFAATNWSVAARALRYQTLQPDPLVPVARPYELMPQVSVKGRVLLNPYIDTAIDGEYTDFRFPEGGRPEARRTVLYPKLALPYITPGFHLTPRLGMHTTHYSFAEPVPGIGDSYRRAVPIMSLDSGLVFERQIDAFERKQTQTLEPRLYYLKVPFRQQSDLASAGINFDSSVLDFNFAQMFSENQFSGHDRIADADQLTLALSSRLLDETSGKEYFRAMFGQRFYFSEQRVTLNPADAPRTDKKTDILGALSGEVLPHTFLDAATQYNPRDSRFERMNIAARYQPVSGRVFNAAYRLSRLQAAPFDVDVRNVDFSAQWPLYGRWQAVGRYNYSLKENRLIESLAGFEYLAGCWSTRLVLQQFAVSTSEYKTAIFMQLELTDFGRLGNNPLEAISRGVTGYNRNTTSAGNAGPQVP